MFQNIIWEIQLTIPANVINKIVNSKEIWYMQVLVAHQQHTEIGKILFPDILKDIDNT